jgi:hypothetical protein
VFDTVRVAFHLHLRHGAVRSLTRLRPFYSEERQIGAETEEAAGNL